MDKVKVKINIAGREYPMTVSVEEEEILRVAGKTINDIIQNFEKKYNVRDKQDALAMCSLQYVAKTLSNEKEGELQQEQRVESIEQLVSRIKSTLNN